MIKEGFAGFRKGSPAFQFTTVNIPALIHEDETMLVFDKPAGLPVRALPSNRAIGSLMEQVRMKYGAEVFNVHRLDQEESGLVICAKNKKVGDFLAGEFQSKRVELWEHAICRGVLPDAGEGISRKGDDLQIDRNLIADASRPGCVFPMKRKGQESLTRLTILEIFRTHIYLKARALSARLHQVRAHLAWAGMPILNDKLYGPGDLLLLSDLKRGYKKRADEKPLIRHLALHAGRMVLRHPLSKEPLVLETSLPKEFEIALKYLRKFGK